MKLYYIYTQRICAELMLLGYKLISLEPSEKREGYNVFGFEDTGKLRKEIKRLMTTNK